MDVLRRYTRRSLAENKTRSLVTIIGIVLSMSLFTAVIEGAYSGMQFLANSVRATEGAYEMYYYNVDADTAKQVVEDNAVKSYATWQEVGWADIGSANPYKPYLLIEDFSDNIEDFLAINITQGRMPENDSEILLPNHLADNGQVFYNVGDTLTVSVGRRVSEGWDLTVENPWVEENNEEIADGVTKTYTIVGKYDRLDTNVEFYNCPGYTAFTKGGGQGKFTVFLTMKNPRGIYNYIESSTVDAPNVVHRDLLRMMGVVRNGSIASVIYGFAAVLVFLICFGSISLIYNSFSISVSERTKQFGILKSVGATKKQIRHSVLYEAAVLAGAGIPIGLVTGCVGIGVTLYLLRDAFNKFMYSSSGVQMKLVLNPAALLIAVVVCLVTTLISAWIPARRTDKVSAIDAIRQSGDVKIRAREVKTSRLTQKLFGFEGMMASKNFKRNRKRYRSTVISLFLSVTLFISASSFCSYLTDIVKDETSYISDVDISYYTVGDDKPDPNMTLDMLSAVNGVEKSAYVENNYQTMFFDSDVLTPELIEKVGSFDIGDGDTSSINLRFAFLDDTSFNMLCEENNIDPSEFFDTASPKGIMYNRLNGMDENGKLFSVKFADEAALPTVFRAINNIDGYVNLGLETDGDGRQCVVYYSEEYMEEYWRSGGGEPDKSKAMLVPLEEATTDGVFTVTRTIDSPYFTDGSDQPVIYYPYSLRTAVMGGALFENTAFETDFYFTAQNHGAVHDAMQKLLTEKGMDTSRLRDEAEDKDTMRTMVLVINVFSYGFIILISLIAVANVFNTISTNISLRRREFAMLKSIGMGSRGFNRMMNYECLIYGMKGLIWGLPASAVITYAIYRVTYTGFSKGFYIPWYSVTIAVGSVFAVVFATMIYAMSKIKKDNPIDALKNENL